MSLEPFFNKKAENIMLHTLQISLSQLRFHAHHGVLPQEREVGGDFIVSLQLYIDQYDAQQALYHDQLCGTINYAEVYDLVRDEMQQPAQLLEHVVARIARRLIHTYDKLRQVDVKLTKCTPPIAGWDGQGVSVSYTQRREITIWDFDGTIADTSAGIKRTMHATFDAMNFAQPTDEAICATIGLPLLTSIAQLANLPADDARVQQATDVYRELFEQVGNVGITLFNGVAHEMQRQHLEGRFVAIATSRGHESVHHLCQQLGILQFIDHIVACEDVSTHKPDPAPVQRLCQLTHVLPADAIVIGDTTYDIEMGRNAGVGLCYGVAWGNHSAQQLMQAGADKVIVAF